MITAACVAVSRRGSRQDHNPELLDMTWWPHGDVAQGHLVRGCQPHYTACRTQTSLLEGKPSPQEPTLSFPHARDVPLLPTVTPVPPKLPCRMGPKGCWGRSRSREQRLPLSTRCPKTSSALLAFLGLGLKWPGLLIGLITKKHAVFCTEVTV